MYDSFTSGLDIRICPQLFVVFIGRVFLNIRYMEVTPIMMVRVRLGQGLCLVATMT